MRAMLLSAPLLASVLTAVLSPVSSAAQAEPPKVVASIKPIHSLVAAVMQGVGQPDLLVKGSASAHTYSLKPSDAKALAAATLIVRVGPTFEGFLDKPLKGKGDKVLSLMDQPGMVLLESREGGAWEAHDHGKEHAHGKEHDHGKAHAHGDHDDDHDEINDHLWLDPDNAKRIVQVTAEALAKQDPANAATYRSNAVNTAQRIDALDAELKAALAPIKAKPFVVFHDAYQYFEGHYDLAAVGSITVNPDRRPSAKRLSAIRAKISGLSAACVFAEPQFEPALVNTIVEGTKARTGVLDPEGADLTEGPDLYFTLMRKLASGLTGCLGA